MHLMAAVVENLIKPTVLRGLLAWERRESGVAYDFISEEARTDPYPTYRRLRTLDPVHRMRTIDAWALTRYRDVEAVLRDHARFANADRVFVETISMSLLELDPPEHTRLRLLVSKAFTPRAVARLHGRIQRITDELLDAVAGVERFDLVAALGYPLPVTVIAEMLGVRPRDLDLFKGWSNVLALSVNAILTTEEVRAIKQAADEAYAYFETIIDERRRQPREDLVSALLAAEEEGDRLTREEMLAVMLLILVAGNETTRNLIGNGMLALLRNPGELRRLREDPGPARLGRRGAAALRQSGPTRRPDRARGRGDRRQVHPRRQAGGGDHRRRQPRPGGVRRSGDPGHRARRKEPPVLRARHPLLPGRGAGRAGGAHRLRQPARPLPVDPPGAEPRYRDNVVLRGLDELWIEVEPG